MNVKDEIKRVLEIEASSLNDLIARIDDSFEKAVDIILKCKGKVIVAGIGKSGLIGQKISATMSSTGTPSVFLHPVEAAHGDIGIISRDDVMLLMSQSGETDEVIEILPAIKRLNIPVISITGKADSSLAKNSACVLDSSVGEEACPMGLAPTASTTVQLAIGDAIAVVLLKKRNFKKDDFAMLHPGGSLGKKLVLKVSDIMHSGEQVPQVLGDTKLQDALLEMTKKRFGCTAVTGTDGKLQGIFTDGDLRRVIEREENPFGLKISEVMTSKPKVITADELAITALTLMEEKAITVLVVVDEGEKPVGVIHLHDILKSGVV